VIELQDKRIKILEDYLRLAKQKQFGSSSEKHPGQGELFNEAELATETDEASHSGEVDSTNKKRNFSINRGRSAFSDYFM